MSTIQAAAIICGGCQRKYAWKPELAGKRVKCKCGEKIAVSAGTSQSSASSMARTSSSSAKASVVKKPKPVDSDPADLDGLFALAEDAERAAAAMPIEVRDVVPEPVIPVARTARKGSAIPLAYQRGPGAAERQKAAAAASSLHDPIRDLYAPLVILLIGFTAHLSFYIVRFHLGSGALVPVAIGVVLLTLMKAACLVGFALLTAGPLGVSFGGLWSAILKLAAIAVFTDGVIAWVDMGVSHIGAGFGGGGIFGFGIVGWPVALGMYWGLLIYLFSMDPGDSWMVVCLLTFFDRVMRTVLLLLLLETILGWGGVAMPTSPASAGRMAGTSSSSIHASALATHVDELKEADALIEANKYISDGHQAILHQPVVDWYANGCTNVWFEMSGRDINGKRSAQGVIVQLPDDKKKRIKCYDILRQYYKDAGVDSDPADVKDDGESYMEVFMR